MRIAPEAKEDKRLNASPELSAEQALPQADFEDVCHLVAEICRSPIALTGVIDAGKQWFRAHHPLITAELAVDFAFCAQAMHHPGEIFITPDLLKDHRFENHLLVTAVPYAAFYCGVPLVTSEGNIMGVLCIWDNKARELSPAQVTALRALARQVAEKIELKKQVATLTQNEAELKNAYSDLENFTTIAAHDLKSPLNAIISLTDLLQNNYAETIDEEGKEYIEFLHVSAQNLTELVTSVLNYSRSSQLITEQKEDINFPALIDEIMGLLIVPSNTVISYDRKEQVIHTNRTALKQIVMNLLDNALKYNDKDHVNITVSLSVQPGRYTVSVTDNGIGIPEEGREKIFELFKKLQNKVNGGKGMGIGLAIVKRLAEKLGGSIALESAPSIGSTFKVILPK